MGFRSIILKFLKSPIGQKVSDLLFSFGSWIEEENRKNIDLTVYEKSHREDFFLKSMRFLSFNKIKGDYLEFGCHGGMTFGLAHKYKHLAKLDMKLYGFDSFKGLPKPKGIDAHDQWEEGDFTVNIKDFNEQLKALGMKDSEYLLVQGFYSESLQANPPSKIGLKKAALVYIDCDLYESTKPVLNYILPLLQTGSILAFDDFYCFNGDPERGGQLALKEFLEKNSEITMSEYLNFGWHGKSFIVKKHD